MSIIATKGSEKCKYDVFSNSEGVNISSKTNLKKDFPKIIFITAEKTQIYYME